MLKILNPIFVIAILAVSGFAHAEDLLLRENVRVTEVNCKLATVLFQEGNVVGLELAIKMQAEAGAQSFSSFCAKLKNYEGTGEPIQLLVKSLGLNLAKTILIQQVVGFIDQQSAQDKNSVNAVVLVRNYTKFKKTLCGTISKTSQACILESKQTARYYVSTSNALTINFAPANKKTSPSKVETYSTESVTLNIDKSGEDNQNREFPAVLSNFVQATSLPLSMH